MRTIILLYYQSESIIKYDGGLKIPIYTLKMRGSLYQHWPENKTINLLNCTFEPGKGEMEFFIKSEFKAENRDNAKILGLRHNQDAVNLFQFCSGEEIKLDYNWEEISEDQKTYGSLRLPITGSIISKSPLPINKIEEIEKAQKTMTNTDEEKKLILIKSIHWWANGEREQDRIDRYIKFWISLEILVEGKGQKLVKKVKEQLIQLYPNSDEENIRELVGRIFGLRGNIVHEGLREPQEVINYTRQLEAILEDLLSSRLNLQFKAKAEKYFDMK